MNIFGKSNSVFEKEKAANKVLSDNLFKTDIGSKIKDLLKDQGDLYFKYVYLKYGDISNHGMVDIPLPAVTRDGIIFLQLMYSVHGEPKEIAHVYLNGIKSQCSLVNMSYVSCFLGGGTGAQIKKLLVDLVIRKMRELGFSCIMYTANTGSLREFISSCGFKEITAYKSRGTGSNISMHIYFL